MYLQLIKINYEGKNNFIQWRMFRPCKYSIQSISNNDGDKISYDVIQRSNLKIFDTVSIFINR